jgi:predicted RNA-binding Zn-ribbon protein involved in translation (DUF1610 family)
MFQDAAIALGLLRRELEERDPGQSFMDLPFELRVTSGGQNLHCPGCGYNGPAVERGGEKYACPKCGDGMVDEAIESIEELGEEVEIEEGADIKALLDRHGLEGVNKPKLTPKHPTKKGVVLARDGGRTKLIRFGAKGYKHNYSDEGRKAFKTRHAKNIAKGKLSAAYWADKVLWSGPEGHKVTREDPKKKARHEDIAEGVAFPDLWDKVVAAARAKFDTYPSAYANAWAVKEYKRRGGTFTGKKPTSLKKGIERVRATMEEADPSSMKVQTLIFSKSKFSRSAAIKWAKGHGFKADKVDEKANTWRLRQKDPDQFGTFRTISFKPGLKAVVAKS